MLEGWERFTWRSLTGWDLSERLQNKAHASSDLLPSGENIDSLTFQPYLGLDTANQDRHIVQQWETPMGTWILAAIFDGHGGAPASEELLRYGGISTAEYAARVLPASIRAALDHMLLVSALPSPSAISTLLQEALMAFDNELRTDLLSLFPDGLESLSHEQIAAIFDVPFPSKAESSRSKLYRCMRTGSTALITLIDPEWENVWVASLGDSTADLLTPRLREWRLETLSKEHNAKTSQTEIDRILQEHPGEEECIKAHRVLGTLEPTRALGDWAYKFRKEVASKLIVHSHWKYAADSPLAAMLGRIKTPPYVSASAEVVHAQLAPVAQTGRAQKRTGSYLIMASDGYMALRQEILKQGKDAFMRSLLAALHKDTWDPYEGNAAVRLLRDGLGGANEEQVSWYVTVDAPRKFLDDVTIIVIPLLGRQLV